MGARKRLQTIRILGVGADREQRIHRARYAAIARETAILSAQHLSRFDAPRRLATLVVFAREMEATLTEAALVMFDKMLGGVFRRADRERKENVVERAKTLDASMRALIGMAKAMLIAKDSGADQVKAVESALGWERLKTPVAEADKVVADTRDDNLAEIVDRYPTVRRMVPVLLGAFVFRAWKSGNSLLAALDVLRDVHAKGQRNLPPRAPTAFLKPAWRKIVGRRGTKRPLRIPTAGGRCAGGSPRPSLPPKGFRSAPSARTRRMKSTRSRGGSMACCRVCASQSFSPTAQAIAWTKIRPLNTGMLDYYRMLAESRRAGPDSGC